MALIISVSGIRGIVGVDLKVADAMKLGMLFGTVLVDKNKPVILAGDSRVSGSALRSAVSAGLMAVGRDVIDIGVVSTPGACLMVRELGAAGAAVVTASRISGSTGRPQPASRSRPMRKPRRACGAMPKSDQSMP